MRPPIVIPRWTLDNFGDSIQFLMNVVRQLNHFEVPAPIEFDFSATKFVNPIILTGLSALQENYLDMGIPSSITCNSGIESYFSTIRFPHGISPDPAAFSDFIKLMESFEGKTYLPITRFPTSVVAGSAAIRDRALSALGNTIQKQLGLPTNIYSGVMYLISELTNNVADHSKAQCGRITAQYFPSKNYMDVCIADCGKGLRASYLDSGIYQPASDDAAIQLALSGNSTKEEVASRGFGIPTSRKLLTQGLRGKLFFWSGEAMHYEDVEGTQILSFPSVSRWQGCLIAMRIPTQNIEGFNILEFVS